MEKLEEFEQRQKELNSEIGRAAGSENGEPNQRCQGTGRIEKGAGALRDEWYENSGSLGEVGSLDAAGTEMKEAAGDLRRDPREARPHGDLAAEALANASSEVEGKMAGLAAGIVDQLSSEAGGLASAQRDLAEDTEKAKPGQGETLKDEQDELNERAKELLEKIDQAARALGDFNENATEDLMKGARDSREDGLERSGKRASNSFCTKLSSSQARGDKVAGNLEKLEEELKGWPTSSGIWNSALRDLVEKLRETQQEMPGMQEGEIKESAEELAKALGELPNAESDERLLNLTPP